MDDQERPRLLTSPRTRRGVLGSLAGGAGGLLVLPAAGALGVRYATARGDDDEDEGGNSGHGGGDNSGHGGGNSGPGGGDDREDEDDAPAAVGEVPPGSLVVRIVNDNEDGFRPSTLTVDAGQSVTFVNEDGDDHTATGSGFDTGIIPEGGMATVVLDEPGTFAYACQIHPEMTGTIGVRGPDGTVPPPAQAAPPPAGATTVEIANFAFDPVSVTVPAGTTVAWTNADAAPHTVTALDGTFDSGIFDPGGGFSWEFTAPGTFPYRCNLHPQMQGTVVVTDEVGNAPAAAAAEEPAPAAPAAAAAPGEAAVAIVDFAFEPATLSVEAGTTVVWTNTGQAPHTVTGSFADSGTLDAGATFRHTFDQEGAFDYVCSFHPQMVGQIQVGPAAAGAPAADDTAAATGAAPGRDVAAHAVVGAWLVVLTPDADAELAPQRALATFHADGTLETVFAAAGEAVDQPTLTLSPGHGAWEEDGEGYALTAVVLLLDEEQRFAGTLTIRETGALDGGGDTYRGTFTFEATGPDGEALATGGGTARGTRVRVEAAGRAPVATADGETGPGPATVTIEGFAFDPPTLEVAVGTTVTWVNRDEAPHTATGDGGEFDTGRLDQGQSGSHTFDQAGTYAYRCNFHPEMGGTVIVT